MRTRSTLRAQPNTSETVTLVVNTRYYGAAYHARCNGKTASRTCCAKCAAAAAAGKAALALVDLGVIQAVPPLRGHGGESTVPMQVIRDQLYHVHLGPANQPKPKTLHDRSTEY